MTPNSTQIPTYSSSTITPEPGSAQKAQVKEHIEALIDTLNHDPAIIKHHPDIILKEFMSPTIGDLLVSNYRVLVNNESWFSSNTQIDWTNRLGNEREPTEVFSNSMKTLKINTKDLFFQGHGNKYLIGNNLELCTHLLSGVFQ